jgi:hypothetical protein
MITTGFVYASTRQAFATISVTEKVACPLEYVLAAAVAFKVI